VTGLAGGPVIGPAAVSGPAGGPAGQADATGRQVTADKELLDAAIRRLLRTVATLEDDDVAGPSGLPGWSRGHVLTHLARAADSRTGLLTAARAGKIGRQYPSEESRAQEIEAGARHPAPVILVDLRQALDRLRDVVAGHAAQLWNAPGEWLGGK